jgi:hypothetical protein
MLDQAADRDPSDVAGRRSGLRQRDAGVDQRRPAQVGDLGNRITLESTPSRRSTTASQPVSSATSRITASNGSSAPAGSSSSYLLLAQPPMAAWIGNS